MRGKNSVISECHGCAADTTTTTRDSRCICISSPVLQHDNNNDNCPPSNHHLHDDEGSEGQGRGKRQLQVSRHVKRDTYDGKLRTFFMKKTLITDGSRCVRCVSNPSRLFSILRLY